MSTAGAANRRPLLVLLIVVLLGCALLLYLVRGTSVVPGDMASFPGSKPAVDRPGVVYKQKPGAEIAFKVSASQQGNLPVSDLHATVDLPVFEHVNVSADPSDLRDGQQATLTIDAVFAECSGASADDLELTAIPVTYDVLVLPRATDLELPGPVYFTPCSPP